MEGGLQIAEIENVTNIEPLETSNSYTKDELEPLLYKMRTTKQKQLLACHFLDLKETYMLKGKTAFNKVIKKNLRQFSVPFKNSL